MSSLPLIFFNKSFDQDKKICYNKWGILPYTKAEVIYDSDMSEK